MANVVEEHFLARPTTSEVGTELKKKKKKKKFTSSGSVLLCLHPLALMPGELYGE